MAESLLWYDFETSGTSPIFDRALQFAAIRTNLDLEPIEEPINLFCYPGDDVAPDPDAMLVTGLKMSDIKTRGLSEIQFSQQILKHFSVPQTCVVGFNSIRFDDEFARNMFYRNFHDPYGREWQGGNSRWDVIDLFRMAAALRPDGYVWPVNEQGTPSFRLEKITESNGISHEGAHDAVADVLATIESVKRLRAVQPKLYEYLFQLRRKKAVVDQLYPLGKQAVVHVSSMYPAKQHCIAVVLPMTTHPTNPNGIICFDLTQDPSDLIEIGPDELHRRIFTPNTELDQPRIPLKTIHVNRAPAIAPLGTITARAAKLEIDLEACESNKRKLQQAAGIVEKIQEAFSRNEFESTNDPDAMLYQGDFFGGGDKQIMAAVHEAEPAALPAFASQFEDTRLPEMLFRYRARNFPQSLTAEDGDRWQAFLAARFSSDEAQHRRQKLAEKLVETPDEPILLDLERHYSSISAG